MKLYGVEERLKARQFDKDEVLLDEQYKEIANLIYDTDGYIFPALFENNDNPRKAAEIAISYVLKMEKDRMYNKENLFVCFEGEKVVGMILWCYGVIDWNYNDFIASSQQVEVNLSYDSVVGVNDTLWGREYSGHKSDLTDTITLIHVCVDSLKRGTGVGSFMLREFVSIYGENDMELSVLKDNKPAISLYRNNGFAKISEYFGFSTSELKPVCYIMQRKPFYS